MELQAPTWTLVSITSLSFVVNCRVLCSRNCNKLISITLDSSLQDGSNYSSDEHAVRAKRAAEKSAHGDQSFLPPSSPPEQSGSEESKPDVEDSPSPSCKRKSAAVKINNMSDRNSSDLPLSKKPGTLSNEALEEICVFSDEVKVKADQLGQQFGRSARDILMAAGFSIKPLHTKINKANLFRSWYWATQPKPEGGMPLSSPTFFKG